MKQTLKLSWVLIALLAITVITSCKKDDDDVTEPTAGFSFQVDATNPMLVHFTNTSVNATSYSWDFGDGTTSTDKDPDHEFTEAGTFQVKLTATNSASSDVVTQPVDISNPDALKDILTGGDQKTWRLVRSSAGVFPLEVGPQDKTSVWWSFGGATPLAERTCLLNDDWTFKDDGTMEFRANGDYWGEAFVGTTRIFAEDLANKCNPTTDMRGPNDEDLSVWGDGDHQFSIASGKLTVTGLGAYIGLVKIGTEMEVTVPQQSVAYDIVSLTEGTVDTLIIESKYMTPDAVPQAAYWRVVLVHYDNPGDEPPIPTGNPPSADFNYSADGLTVTFTNTSSANPDTYTWNFGDGSAESTEANPTHTYATPGYFEVTMNATNENGTGTAAAIVLASEKELTEADLLGTWKIRLAEKSVFVGPGMGGSNWWAVPLADMQEGGSWSCMMDDEFIFSTGGVYEYKTNGNARNDGYKGQAGGCFTDAELQLLDFPFLSATHTWAFNATGADQTITLTNGASQAAFIGFYKGYYGGENDASATEPNGGNATNQYQVMGYATIDGVDYLYLSVDLNGGVTTEKGAWSVILQRAATK